MVLASNSTPLGFERGEAPGAEAALAAGKRGSVYIGTSGWSNLPWGKGRALPAGVRSSDRLAYYSRLFGSVEVNSTFYRLPARAVAERWAASTGPGFRFAVKLSRLITHARGLGESKGLVRAFLDAVLPLAPKRGPLLVQLPPNAPADLALLDAFLGELHDAMGEIPWRIAVEPRSRAFRLDALAALLDRHGAALVQADMPACPITEENDAPFVYIRRHGPKGDYQGGYAASRLEEDAEKARRAAVSGRDVFIYFNNTIADDAVVDALRLAEILARPSVGIALAGAE